MRKTISTLLKIAVSVSVLALLIRTVGVEKVANTIARVDLSYYPFILAIYIISLFLGAINIKLLLNAIGKKINWYVVFKYTTVCWALGLLTPGKIGEFSIAYLLKREGVNFGEGMAIAVVDKIITFLSLSLFAVVGFVMFLGVSTTIKFIGLLLGIIMLGLLLLSQKGRIFIQKYLLKKYSHLFKNFYTTISELVNRRKFFLFINSIITIIKWVMSAVSVLIIFWSLGATGDFVGIVIISITLIILNLVPFTYHGIGIKETLGVYLYGFIGISPEVVVTTYVIFNILAYGLAAVAILLYLNEFQGLKKEMPN